MLERDFQRNLKKELKERFPGCIVMKNDANQVQGIPDLLILYEDTWATLECKASAKATCRPNQKRRVDMLNRMSYSAIIFPENKEEILDDMARSFERHSSRNACVSES